MTRIVSGGQTGVDRAALDVALELGIACGGWCPKGRLAEDGPLPERYPLDETPTAEYAERTAWNVRDSDGTLILTWGPPADGTAFTEHVAREMGKPCLVVDLMEKADVREARAWFETNRVRVLNVAGPRASKCAGLYEDACSFLKELLSGNPPGGTAQDR